ncbi:MULTISPECIES: MDR family MFS transporter [Thermoactinomyces]|uniref:Multidrug efflux MFS transporter n=1 Tax=Thermoactinomyces vulgaris TaxID=2026 RepID=A0ABS0QGF8_THEVU|nr:MULTISPECIES: MDR family MFS transporter [Thermoactinomyces]KFZ41529.1 major facilitator transporter [Thermoactinomyces sp. Gus2-1]MBA4551885.1 multidrug efflux MFS transporter [Thermoactinomyces vulgaris]MBA4597216.1 multidrug efflux MFS transporter [Thermoactinomyces vulgaris]MBH8588358.1 multidrug efflux MFS transporter [Thermoactinomyces vulgaris]MBI0387435.1 multidrug efflux MFS transporter [Thermoactinomyces sp. CICC 24227]
MEKDKLPKGLLSIAWILVLGALPPMLDSTIVNIAVNDLAKVFSASFVVTQWVVTGYVLALGMAVPFSGWLMQKYDGKKVYMYALGLFLISSLLSGFAWNIESLIAFRVLQGIASGIIIPTLTTLVAQAAGGENIGRLMSVVGIPVVFGPIAGPVIGGLILQHSEWQWLFFVNLPVGALALIIAQWKLPKFEPVNRSAKLDWIGILLLAMLSGMFIYGITEIRAESKHAATGILALGIAFLSLISYLLYAWKQKSEALIPLDLFQSKNFSAVFFSLFLAGFATNGPMLLFPMFFQNVLGLDVITSALWLIPQGLGMLVARPLIGNLTDKIGARYVVLPSIAITIIGTFPFIFFDVDSAQWIIWIVLFIRGIGVGGITVPVMSDAYVGLEKSQMPAASVATRIIQNVGAASGSAILATVVSHVLGGAAAANLAGAYHSGFVTSLIFMGISILPALFLTDKLKNRIQGPQVQNQ